MRKRKTRKVYQLVNPVTYAIEGAAVADEKLLNALRQGELLAIEAFRQGAAQVQDWQRIADLCNLTESMAKAGIGPEALEAVKRCEQALVDAYERFNRVGKIGTTGQGLTAMRDVYEYHDLQRQSVARSVYEKHIEAVANKIRSKSPHVTVVHRREK